MRAALDEVEVGNGRITGGGDDFKAATTLKVKLSFVTSGSLVV